MIDPVTKMDIEMEKIIRTFINKNFSKHNIIGEELKKIKILTLIIHGWLIQLMELKI